MKSLPLWKRIYAWTVAVFGLIAVGMVGYGFWIDDLGFSLMGWVFFTIMAISEFAILLPQKKTTTASSSVRLPKAS